LRDEHISRDPESRGLSHAWRVLEGRGRPLQPKSAGLPGITRQRVGLPLKIFQLSSLLLLLLLLRRKVLLVRVMPGPEGERDVYYRYILIIGISPLCLMIIIPLPLTKRQMMLANDVGIGWCTC